LYSPFSFSIILQLMRPAMRRLCCYCESIAVCALSHICSPLPLPSSHHDMDGTQRSLMCNVVMHRFSALFANILQDTTYSHSHIHNPIPSI